MSSRLPLLVHLIFHPESDTARALAEAIHHALNEDPNSPGLRVPVVFASEDGTGFPPLKMDPDEADRNVWVVLADDKMALDPTAVPDGRQIWSEFVGDLFEQCQGPGHRFLPLQLSENAYPLDDRLDGINFLRAHFQKDDDRTSWVIRALVVEICRFLLGEERGDRLPLRLFLSHAKQDIKAAPEVFNAMISHLQTTQPVETWVDSAKIETGSRFAEVITAGVKDCVVLALVTRNYSSRHWCRMEMLIAKRNQRPLVVVDAQEGVEIRSFPYGGNTPRIRWPESRVPSTEEEAAAAAAAMEKAAAAAVDLLLKETLRHCHSRLVLGRHRRGSDFILASQPEPTSVSKAPPSSTILYPDPPVGDEEKEELEGLGRILETPLQRAAQGRSFAGKRIILSSSESGETLRHGFIAKDQDAALIEISRQLLARGATLEYGGNLGAESYTVALFDMARAYQGLSGVPAGERIVNDVGWPLPLETLPEAVRAKHKNVAVFRRIPRPEGVEHLDPGTFLAEPHFFPADTPQRRYAWARGMTAMRRFQAEESGAAARVVIGGKIGPTLTSGGDGAKSVKWYMSRIPGVVEEVLLSLRARQPVFLVGAFGGAAEVVIDLLEGRSRPDFTWNFQKDAPHAEAMRDLYQAEGQPWEDYDEMTAYFRELSVKGLAELNRLSPEENRELFVCRDLTRMVELILEGVAR